MKGFIVTALLCVAAFGGYGCATTTCNETGAKAAPVASKETATATKEDSAVKIDVASADKTDASGGKKDSEPAKEEKPKTAEYYFTEGLMAINHGNLNKAEKNLLEALRMKPESVNARLYLARVYERKRQFMSAIQEYTVAAGYAPKDARAVVGMMNNYLDMGAPKEAVISGEKAIERGVNEGAVRDTLGWSYYLLGELDKAEDNFLKAAKLTTQDTAPLNNLGLVYFEKGRYEDAMARFEEARKLNPKSQLAPYFIALARNKMGQEDKATEALKDALAQDKDLQSKTGSYKKEFFPRADTGDLTPLFEKIKAEK